MSAAELSDPAVESRRDEAGGGAKVLLLHGFFSCKEAWNPVRRELGDTVPTVAPDLLGYHGAHGDEPYDLEHLVAHLLPLVDAQRPTHVVGHSMGAIVALALAGARPGQFERLGLIGLPVYRDRRDGLEHLYRRGWAYRLLLRQHDVAHVGCVALHRARRAWRPLAPVLVPKEPAEVVVGSFDHCRASHHGGLEAIVFGGMVEDLASRVDSPVTLLHGGRDKAAPPDRAKLLAAEHGWPFELAPTHGHQNILHRPRYVARWVREQVLEGATAER